jgi:hypothetical protein
MRTRFFPLVICLALAAPAASAGPAPAPAPNVVAQRAVEVQQAIHNASAPRSAGTAQVLHTMVMLAVYDAVMAIDGGYRPYAARIKAPAGADVRAAVATAAYLTAAPRLVPAEATNLGVRYAAFMAAIPDGPGRAGGIAVGQAAAAAMLARRANDGFANVVPYSCSEVPPPPGEFVPDTGCPANPSAPQPVDVKVGFIMPFTYADPARLRPDGPEPTSSSGYVEDFEETRDYGRADSVFRTAEQTDVAYFWAEHPYVHWNRNLVNLAVARNLDVAETARFFAMVHTAASDAVIAGFAAKYYYTAWRPRTAIVQADADDNPDTDADPTWRPLLSVNHPEYPSGHGFWSAAVLDAVGAYFRKNRLTWTITTSKAAVPALVKTERTYDHLNTLMREIGDARVWAGLHWRHAIRHGMQVGRRVAAHVTRHYFRPTR